MAVILTLNQRNVLNHVLCDPAMDADAWAARNEVTTQKVEQKVAKYQQEYDDAVAAVNYKTWRQKEIEQKQLEQDRANSPEAKRNLTVDQFEARFTIQEWDACYDFVYKVNTTTGLHERRFLVQGWERAIARNRIDLLDPKTIAFMQALVTGGVISSAKRDAILTP